MYRLVWVVALSLCAAALSTGCGSGHRSGNAPSGPRLAKLDQAKKIKEFMFSRKLVGAAGPKRVVPRRSPCAHGMFPVWSPLGNEIAWVGQDALCVADPDGENIHVLAHTRGLVDGPFKLDWVRPRLLLYGDNYRIFRIPVGGVPRILVGASAPEFTADSKGNRFSVSTSSDCPSCVGPATVWSVEGAYIGAVGNKHAFNDPPSLSPNGSRVVFEQGGGVWTASADGSHPQPLESAGAGAPIWSPVSKVIAFVSGSDLRVVPPSGGPSRLVAKGMGNAQGWSPNGKLIASYDAAFQLRVVDVSTGKVRRLPWLGGYVGGWSPDSKELLVSGQGATGRCSSLWRVPVNGSKPRLVSSCY